MKAIWDLNDNQPPYVMERATELKVLLGIKFVQPWKLMLVKENGETLELGPGVEGGEEFKKNYKLNARKFTQFYADEADTLDSVMKVLVEVAN